ncbi:sugar transferase [Paenibacillus flagellatus]|uniref:Sugar transferase n=1 Tax=Paenibacillus flagellatus TaxID=2211139 RepID=A0A2V5KDW7_9BACL|nr:sugar transferase [Paenibacillus flagellatus]PYI57192.1 sugar transferase [Paenibacillus flagellatus]
MKLKRGFDLTVALVGLLILWPIMAIVALLVRIRLGSPVMFKQVRPGLHAKPFNIYKFRTMANLYDSAGELLPEEQRLLPFGIFLRKYSLDELPQLFNVIKGDLSLVGPRPLLMKYVSLYSEEQARRHEVRPGITGWAQINGRNSLSWEEKFALDVWYVDNRSFGMDLYIIGKTVMKVFRSEGVNYSEHVTMPEFQGNSRKAGG